MAARLGLAPPRFLADDIDGSVLFDVATARRRALDEGRTDVGGVASLGDIVAVPPVRKARDAGLLKASPMFRRLVPGGVEWADGTRAEADAIIWCTGFRPALSHLAPLQLASDAATSPRRAPARSANRVCPCSETATGPAPPPPR